MALRGPVQKRRQASERAAAADANCVCAGEHCSYYLEPWDIERAMTGRKILIVEDDPLIAMELEERLGELGYVVLGPVGTLDAAEQLIAAQRPDAALLDANLDGVSSAPLGVKLAGMRVPFAFCTGYDTIKNAPAEVANAPVLTKPISDADLKAGLKTLLP
jgi:DNA-binding response OmpR family regulator